MTILNLFYLANTSKANGGNGWSMWLMIIVLLVFMYFFVMRPQRKMQQKQQQREAGLKKGDRVMMSSGLYGKVDKVNREDQTVVIDADGLFLTYNIRAIAKVINDENPVTKTELKENETKEENNTEESSSSDSDKKDE